MERLESIGWAPEWASVFEAHEAGGAFVPARVIEEQRGMLRCLCEAGEVTAEVSGRLRYLAMGPEELPGVGDWVVVDLRAEELRGTIHAVLPRRTALVRKMPGDPPQAQLLAANVDTVLVTTSLNRDFRPRRIERTLALVRESGALGVVVLTKLDLVDAPESALEDARAAAAGHEVIALSSVTGEGVEGLAGFLRRGHTLALLGASGVGKSTLVNRLLGEARMATNEIRTVDDKGRHTTTHRQLVALSGGVALIDTPGMREVGLWDDEEGVSAAFPDVDALLGACRFGDCGHGNEPGCALRAAIESGELAEARWAHYQKLKREAAKLEERRTAQGRHQRRKRSKAFAKRIRDRPDKRRPPR